MRALAHAGLSPRKIILSTSSGDGLAYTDTSNLDGEATLKMRQAASELTQSWQTPTALQAACGYIDVCRPLRAHRPSNPSVVRKATKRERGAVHRPQAP